jgi:hypothetical protein
MHKVIDEAKGIEQRIYLTKLNNEGGKAEASFKEITLRKKEDKLIKSTRFKKGNKHEKHSSRASMEPDFKHCAAFIDGFLEKIAAAGVCFMVKPNQFGFGMHYYERTKGIPEGVRPSEHTKHRDNLFTGISSSSIACSLLCCCGRTRLLLTFPAVQSYRRAHNCVHACARWLDMVHL